MKLVYDVKDRPKFGKLLLFAFQQLLAILASTIAVPAMVGNGMSPSAALFGAGIGTIVYLLFTSFQSPVFLGSSFAFIGSMSAAFAGAVSISAGYAGLIIGAAMAGLVYVVIAFVIKLVGTAWIAKLMPAVVIGPTVALIGLSLAESAVSDLFKGGPWEMVGERVVKVIDGTELIVGEYHKAPSAAPNIALLCGLVALFTVMLCSVYGKKTVKMMPFLVGIGAGYVVATLITLVGIATDDLSLYIVDFWKFRDMQWLPSFAFLEAIEGVGEIDGAYLATLAVAYVPVSFVVFAEHIADHKNLSTVIGQDLLESPGLTKTLLGDGIGSVVGSFFGGAPNTTYGESVGCVALTRNASIITIVVTGFLAMASAFNAPLVTLLETIPPCVMGGVCIPLYGFIAVSGLKMIQKIDFDDDRILYVVAVILICGVGGLTVVFGRITITSIACSLILGIVANILLSKKKTKAKEEE